MAKKPFLVNIEIELAIFAEKEDDIYHHPDLRDAVQNALDSSKSCISFIDPLKRIPDGWSEDCLVYGADGDVTIKDALNWKTDEDKKYPEDKHTKLLPFME